MITRRNLLNLCLTPLLFPFLKKRKYRETTVLLHNGFNDYWIYLPDYKPHKRTDSYCFVCRRKTRQFEYITIKPFILQETIFRCVVCNEFNTSTETYTERYVKFIKRNYFSRSEI